MPFLGISEANSVEKAAEAEFAAQARGKGPSSHWQRFRVLGSMLLLLVLAAAGYFEYLSIHIKQSFARTEALREAIDENRKLLGYVVDLESGHRGYMLTSDRRQLESFTAADRALPLQLERLENLLKDRDDLIAILGNMKAMLVTKRRSMAVMQDIFEREGRMSLFNAYGKDLGKFEMDSLRRSAQLIEVQLNKAASAERGTARELLHAQTIANAVTLIIFAVVGILALFFGSRHFDALRKQEQLTAALIRSQRRSSDKNAFLAHVSHEIRTPMNAIFGFSSLLHDRLQDPVNRRYIDSITSSARSLLGIINDLLDLSAIEAGKLGVVQRPTSLREVVDGVIALFSPQATAKRLQLSASITPDIPASVITDGDRIRQMLVNLVGNAVKYTQKGEVRLTVTATIDRSSKNLNCFFVVHDTGPGIGAEDLELIFEPFARGTEQRKNRLDGTGLGLSITRQLARAMGGDVTVLSELGVGSRFQLSIPGIPFTREGAQGNDDGLRLSRLPPMRVLIVDDVDLNRQVLAAFFDGSQHETRIAATGDEALAIVRVWKPEVLLLDVRMAGMNGIEVATRLRADARTRAIRIIAVTASRLVPGHAYTELFDGMVLKPFTELALAQEIAQVCGAVTSGETVPGEPEAPFSAPAALLAELQTMVDREWPTVCSTMTIADVRQFAERLVALAERYRAPPLLRYGRTLATAAAGFDVARMETLLASFPGMLKELQAVTAGVEHAA